MNRYLFFGLLLLGIAFRVLMLTQYELVNGGDVDLSLRAERQGTSLGRTYTVTITATDPSGNASAASCDVVAPHDRGNKK